MYSFLRNSGIIVALLAMGSTVAFAADGVSPKAYELGTIPVLNIPITNSMVTSWVFSLILVLVIRWAVGTPKLIPSKGQAVVESILQGVESTIAPIVGKRMVRPTFPLLLSFFIFILINNWSGLLPGVGAFGHYDAHGHLLYYFRPGNADLNMTFALSIISFMAWFYYVLRYAGPKAIIQDLFGNKAEKSDVPTLIYYFMFVIFLAVGVIEVISIIFRLISLSFRLFGNVFGRENLLVSISGISSWILPVPFYFLEVLIGLIQAFIFTLLTAIYIGLICNHGEEEHAH